MLVLTRKQSETIRIGESITITVLRMKGKSVRLGIEAPHHLTVIRGELAFEQGDEEVVAEADEIEEPNPITSESRVCSKRPYPNASWPRKSGNTSGCTAAAWTI